MKKIYTIVLSAAMLLVATDAFAQLSIGVGYLNSTLTTTYKGKEQDKEPSNGLYMGAGFDLPILGENLKLTPGLYLSLLTGKESTTFLDIVTLQSKFTEVAINLPVHLSYGMDMGHAKLFVYGGPTFQYGISSKYKVDGTAATALGVIAADGVIDNYKENDMSPFNIYLGGGLGADLNNLLRVTIGFDYGLLNLYKGDNENTKYNRYNFRVGVGYLF